ncbi:hypothetical protein BO86DRAFT_323151 [Aspergillus japonicus CBS 114.51]|uniref:Transcription factor TFIIIC triple barrel domain-containing protein n=2 Tax=Aspergillus TaxID=5052 RepID=A0A2V5HG64_ASPV1|nr:hypothetical protein BO86DRAFT_323151 [Aspergillus japonicus CBS 114.51]PYI23409.1 hypothetical protein BO99DRAFT_428708 [Aspergillus violaceofuscus CBS 115571]RAH77442.1 hypothetical protein BO86DRAFT_323151 [Aspergillus japonicus CBS 114.51]
MSLPPPIPVDPAMLVDQPHPDSDIDSDYEYEYHPTETETVYLTLDLTSLHGPLRPPRRRQPSATAASSATATNISDEADAAGFTHVESPSDDLQILGLHTPNPIISYQNQIFSGTWADQLGTDLIFARPDEGRRGGVEEQPGETAPHGPYGIHRTDHPDTPLRHGHNYDLLAAPSVKIIGRKANLISASQSSAAAATTTTAATPGSDEGVNPSPGQSDNSPAGLAPTVSTTGIIRAPNHPASNQMRFLERLASLKRSKGETDTVRTVFSTKRIQSDHASSLGGRALGWARTDEQLAEIQRLNELALQGDAAAMAELEALYTRLGEDVEREVGSDDDDDDDDEGDDDDNGNDHDIEMGDVEGEPEVAGEDPTRDPSHDQYLDPEELLSQARRDTQQSQP